MGSSISACMIICNEEKVLARCLDSISNYVEQICIIDTGSTDLSIDIARDYRANVVVCPELSDPHGRILSFAEARNKAIQLATADWLLTIDADEILEVYDGQQLIDSLVDETLNAIEIKIQEKNQYWYVPRLFRNFRDAHYVGRVHEVLVSNPPSRRYDFASIENMPNKSGKESAADRDIRLCELQITHDEGSAKTHINMGRALKIKKIYDDAISHYKKSIKLTRSKNLLYEANLNIGICELLRNNYLDAKCFAQNAYSIYPQLADALCLLADCHLALGEISDAELHYNVAVNLSIPSNTTYYTIDETLYRDYPTQQLELISRIKLMHPS